MHVPSDLKLPDYDRDKPDNSVSDPPLENKQATRRGSYHYGLLRQELLPPVKPPRPSLEDDREERATQEDLYALSTLDEREWTPLSTRALYLPALKEALGSVRERGIDINRLVDRISLGRLMWPLPKRLDSIWPESLHIVFDAGDPMTPYLRDGWDAVDQLTRLQGRLGLSTWVMKGGPLENLMPLDESLQDEWEAGTPYTRSGQIDGWGLPPNGYRQRILLLSDLGAFGSIDYPAISPSVSPTVDAWVRRIKGLIRSGYAVCAMTPALLSDVDASIIKLIPVVHWDGVKRRPPRAALREQSVRQLLALVSMVSFVDGTLIRKFRLLTAIDGLDPSIEGTVWCHEDVNLCGLYIEMKNEKRRQWQEVFARYPLEMRERAGTAIWDALKHQPPSIRPL